MPRGRRGGRRGKKKGGYGNKREIVYKEEGQEYGQVSKLLGSGRMEISCFDGKIRLCKIRGKFKRRVWSNVGDIVLISIREFEEEKGDIIHVYYADEARILKQMGEIPSTANIVENKDQEEGNGFDVEFEDDDQKKKAKPTEKQNLDDFMPSDSSSEEEVQKPKPKPKATEAKKQEKSTVVQKPQSESEESEEQADSDDESKEEYDELADI